MRGIDLSSVRSVASTDLVKNLNAEYLNGVGNNGFNKFVAIADSSSITNKESFINFLWDRGILSGTWDFRSTSFAFIYSFATSGNINDLDEVGQNLSGATGIAIMACGAYTIYLNFLINTQGRKNHNNLYIIRSHFDGVWSKPEWTKVLIDTDLTSTTSLTSQPSDLQIDEIKDEKELISNKEKDERN